MSTVHYLFPSFVFERDFLGRHQHVEPSMNEDYFEQLKNEIDSMRKKDPVGRRVSNAYTGWQSHDGCDTNPAFIKCIRSIKRMMRDEVMLHLGVKSGFQVEFHNCWANINDNMAWNRPHLHNGCFMSGVLYIKADGDEGNFSAIDTDARVVGAHPVMPKMKESVQFQPRTGSMFLFPSGLMHMVEPNLTNKDRYSISFNMNVVQNNLKIGSVDENNFTEDNHTLSWELDEQGKLII